MNFFKNKLKGEPMNNDVKSVKNSSDWIKEQLDEIFD